MTDTSPRQTPAGQIPPDDPVRRLAAASPDRDESLEHLGVVGDTYAILPVPSRSRSWEDVSGGDPVTPGRAHRKTHRKPRGLRGFFESA